VSKIFAIHHAVAGMHTYNMFKHIIWGNYKVSEIFEIKLRSFVAVSILFFIFQQLQQIDTLSISTLQNFFTSVVLLQGCVARKHIPSILELVLAPTLIIVVESVYMVCTNNYTSV